LVLFATDALAFLWLNLVGCLLVMAIASIIQLFQKEKMLQ